MSGLIQPRERIVTTRLYRALTGVLLLSFLIPARASADDPVHQMWAALNQVRAQAGLSPYNLSPILAGTAQAHVDDLLSHGVLGHTGSDGSSLRQRLARVGYQAHWVGENWVVARSLDQAVNRWMNSGPHTRNILHGHYSEIGIGYGEHRWGTLWVLNFGRPEGAAPPPPVATPAPAPETPAAPAPAPASQAPAQPAPSATPEAAPSPSAAGSTHTVQPGETLSGLAVRYGLSLADLMTANGLVDPDRLRAGQMLIIPGGARLPEMAPETAPTPSHYTVAAGDTLWTIALRHGVGLSALTEANRLANPHLLSIGQVLVIP